MRRINNTTFTNVISTIKSSDTVLNLKGYDIGSFDISQLTIVAQALYTKSNCLTSLSLANCQLKYFSNQSSFREEDNYSKIEVFYTAISKLIYLEELSLAGGGYYDYQFARKNESKENGVALFSKNLLKLQKLRILDISDTNFGATAVPMVETIFAGIVQLPNLKLLKLRNCEIGNGKRKVYNSPFADRTKTKPTLNIVAIFDAVSKMQSLEELDLSKNDLVQFSGPEWLLLRDKLTDIKTLRAIDLSENNINWLDEGLYEQRIEFLRKLHHKKIAIKIKEKILIDIINIESMDLTLLRRKLGMAMQLDQYITIVFDTQLLGNVIKRLDQFITNLRVIASDSQAEQLFIQKFEDICFYIYGKCMDCEEIEHATNALLLVPESSSMYDKARSYLFRELHNNYREGGYNSLDAFSIVVKYCYYTNGKMIVIDGTVQAYFDAALSEACGIKYSPGQSMNAEERSALLRKMYNLLKLPNKQEAVLSKSNESKKYEQVSDKKPDDLSQKLLIWNYTRKGFLKAPPSDTAWQDELKDLRVELKQKYYASKLHEFALISFTDINLIVADNAADFAEYSITEVEVYNEVIEKISLRASLCRDIILCLSIDQSKLPTISKFYFELNSIINSLTNYLENISQNYVDRFKENQSIRNKLKLLPGYHIDALKVLQNTCKVDISIPSQNIGLEQWGRYI